MGLIHIGVEIAAMRLPDTDLATNHRECPQQLGATASQCSVGWCGMCPSVPPHPLCAYIHQSLVRCLLLLHLFAGDEPSRVGHRCRHRLGEWPASRSSRGSIPVRHGSCLVPCGLNQSVYATLILFGLIGFVGCSAFNAGGLTRCWVGSIDLRRHVKHRVLAAPIEPGLVSLIAIDTTSRTL